MKNLLGLLGCVVATIGMSQNATIIPQGQRMVGLEWKASPDPSAVGYRIYFGGPVSGAYTNSIIAQHNSQAIVSGLKNDTTYHFAATAYNSVGEESPFSNEVRVFMGQAATVNSTNISGNWYYELSQTRNTNDNVFRMMQSETTNNWKNVTGVQKISETLIDTDTYRTTWLIPASQPLVPMMYFKSEWLINFEDPNFKLRPQNFRVIF